MTRWKPRRLLLTGTVCVFPLALPSAALAVPLPVGGLVAVMFVSGVAVEVFGVAWMTSLHQEIPEEKLSRVAAYDWFGSTAMLPLSTAVAGPVADLVGLSHALWGCAALVTLVTALVLLVPDVRNLTRRAEPAAADRPREPAGARRRPPDPRGRSSADAEGAAGRLGRGDRVRVPHHRRVPGEPRQGGPVLHPRGEGVGGGPPGQPGRVDRGVRGDQHHVAEPPPRSTDGSAISASSAKTAARVASWERRNPNGAPSARFAAYRPSGRRTRSTSRAYSTDVRCAGTREPPNTSPTTRSADRAGAASSHARASAPCTVIPAPSGTGRCSATSASSARSASTTCCREPGRVAATYRGSVSAPPPRWTTSSGAPSPPAASTTWARRRAY